MPTASYKILGQVAPAANTNTDLYTVPTSTQTVCSTLSVCNRDASTNCRVAVRNAGASLNTSHYIVYDKQVNQSDTLFLTIGVTLNVADVITVSAGTGNVTFNLFGSEIA